MYKLRWVINERIKLAREAVPMTPAELARRTKVKPSSVSLWESGKNTPSVKNLIQIAIICRVRFEWLATGRGAMPYEDGVGEEPPPYTIDDFPKDQQDLLQEYLRLKPGQRHALLAFLKKL